MFDVGIGFVWKIRIDCWRLLDRRDNRLRSGRERRIFCSVAGSTSATPVGGGVKNGEASPALGLAGAARSFRSAFRARVN